MTAPQEEQADAVDDSVLDAMLDAMRGVFLPLGCSRAHLNSANGLELYWRCADGREFSDSYQAFQHTERLKARAAIETFLWKKEFSEIRERRKEEPLERMAPVGATAAREMAESDRLLFGVGFTRSHKDGVLEHIPLQELTIYGTAAGEAVATRVEALKSARSRAFSECKTVICEETSREVMMQRIRELEEQTWSSVSSKEPARSS